MFSICTKLSAGNRAALACRSRASKAARKTVGVSSMNPQTPFEPKNAAQQRLMDLLADDGPAIVVATGPAGCGKTFVAATMGAIALSRGLVDKIVVCRPAVTAGEDHGFLPGGINAKMAPWARPMTDALRRYWTPEQLRKMIADEVIELCPIAFCRGRTFERSWVMLDEASSCTTAQMRLMLTRVGEGTRMVVTGDLAQSDIGDQNGLADLVQRVDEHDFLLDDLDTMSFDDTDVVRHRVVAEVLSLYGPVCV